MTPAYICVKCKLAKSGRGHERAKEALKMVKITSHNLVRPEAGE